jgi:hypothetical protein
MTSEQLTAEPTRLQLLQQALSATGATQEAVARTLCVTMQRDAMARGLMLLKLECAREEYAHGEIPTRVVLTFIDEIVNQACAREARMAARLVRLTNCEPA